MFSSRKRKCSNLGSNDGQVKRRNVDQALSEQIEQLYKNCCDTPHTNNQRKKLRDCLWTIFKKAFPKCSLNLVGSSSNGFATSSADADMCLMLTKDNLSKSECISVLSLIKKTIRRLPFISFPLLIRAKVPILRFTDLVSGIIVDLNINNSIGIENTLLMQAYSQKDNRVRPLVIMFKEWAKINNINSALEQTLSSYSLLLMAIHYLQSSCEPPVLPVISIQNKSEWSRIWTSENKQSLGYLFVGLLRYYSVLFDFNKYVISVRLGGLLFRQQLSTFSSESGSNLICIEEPFELTNVARCVNNSIKFKFIKKVFDQSYQQLNRSKSIYCIMPLNNF